jgi:hypothetical protein
MWVSSVIFDVPSRQMHCDGLGISSQLIRNKLQVSGKKKGYGEKWYRLGRTNTGTVAQKQPE